LEHRCSSCKQVKNHLHRLVAVIMVVAGGLMMIAVVIIVDGPGDMSCVLLTINFKLIRKLWLYMTITYILASSH
jgi:hypothetical protein